MSLTLNYRFIPALLLLLLSGHPLLAKGLWVVEVERSGSEGWQTAVHLRRMVAEVGKGWADVQFGALAVPRPSGWNSDGSRPFSDVIDGPELYGHPSFATGVSLASNLHVPFVLTTGIETRLTVEWLDWERWPGYVPPDELIVTRGSGWAAMGGLFGTFRVRLPLGFQAGVFGGGEIELTHGDLPRGRDPILRGGFLLGYRF
ncbi:MAG: hypothetical protein V2A56_11650 [bacterium]